MINSYEAVPSLPSPSLSIRGTDPGADTAALPDPAVQPLLREPEVRRALPGMSRSAVYDAVARGDLPSIRVGRRLYIPNAELRARLHLPATNASTEAQA